MSIQVINNSDLIAAAKPAGQDGQGKSAPEAHAAAGDPVVDSDTTEAEAKEKVDESEKEESDEEDADEADAADDGDESDKDKPKKKSGAQRRRERAERAQAEITRARADAEHWRSLALKGAGEPRPEKPEPKAEAEPTGKPKSGDFETLEEYLEARDQWNRSEWARESKAEARQSELKGEQDKQLEAHLEREKAFIAKTDDYEDVVKELLDSKPATSATFEQLLVTSEHGPAILYELAKNRAELDRIQKLPPLAAALAMGRLEAKLSGHPESKPKPEPKKQTSAPQPINPVGSKGGPVEKSIYDPNLSQADFEAAERQRMKRKAAAW